LFCVRVRHIRFRPAVLLRVDLFIQQACESGRLEKRKAPARQDSQLTRTGTGPDGRSTPVKGSVLGNFGSRGWKGPLEPQMARSGEVAGTLGIAGWAALLGRWRAGRPAGTAGANTVPGAAGPVNNGPRRRMRHSTPTGKAPSGGNALGRPRQTFQG